MMMTRLKKKMRSTRNQKVDRKRRGIKRLVIPASRRSARVSKQSCGERTDVTATPRKGVITGELRTNRGPPLSLSRLAQKKWYTASFTVPRSLLKPRQLYSARLLQPDQAETDVAICTGKSGEEEETTRILGISVDL